MRCASESVVSGVLREPAVNTSIHLGVAAADAGGDRRSDEIEQGREIVRQCVGRQVGAGRDHAAADVDADRRRHECAVGGDHGADSGANADVRVGHERERSREDRQTRGARRLHNGALVEVERP
jgi:hypothetical protein